MAIITHIKRFISWGLKELRMFFSPIDIKFYNHWSTFLTENLPHKMWFYRFMKNRKIDTRVTFFSVEGYRWFIKCFRGKKIFYSAEFLHTGGIDKKWQRFSDHCVNEVDLAIGYDNIELPNYVRFPLWMIHLVQPEMTFEDLKKRIEEINAPEWRLNRDRSSFAVQISHHDINGNRKILIDLLNTIDKVTCAGKFMNTTDELKTKYNDDKWLYLKKFKFNICPENVSAKGYVTEKILDAFVGGCIPIYWGGGKKEWVESDIFNPEAFLYYEEGKEQELVAKVKELWTNEESYEEFARIPPFKENSAQILWDKIKEIEKRLREL